MMNRLTAAFGLLCSFASIPLASAAELPVAKLPDDKQVNFEAELLPVLRKKCLACHNQTDAESDFVAENPQSILAGGASGPGVVPGDADASWMMTLAAHRDEPIMPPADNDAGAEPMTADELALLERWIQQGATGTVSGKAKPIDWQRLSMKPIFAAAQTANGRFVAAGRGNQIWIYDLRLKQLARRLTDPALADSPAAHDGGISHLDFVQSLAFSPNGQLLASGGYRTVKFWQRVPSVAEPIDAGVDSVMHAAAVGENVFLVDENGILAGVAADGHRLPLTESDDPVTAIAASTTPPRLATIVARQNVQVRDSSGRLVSQVAAENAALLSLAVGPRHLVTATAAGSILVWPLDEAGQLGEIKSLSVEGPVAVALAITADHRLLVGYQDGQVDLWNLENGQKQRQWNVGTPLTDIAAAGDRFVTLSDQRAKLWGLEQDAPIATLEHSSELAWQVTENQLREQTSKRHVENANADLNEAKKRLEEEEKNLQKSVEARDKAAQELEAATAATETARQELALADQAVSKAKQEAAPPTEQADTEQADTEQADTEQAAATAQEALKQAEEAQKAKREAVEKAEKELQAKQQTAESTERSVETAEKTVDAARERVSQQTPLLESAQQAHARASETLQASRQEHAEFNGAATRIAISPDGSLIATGNDAGRVLLFDAAGTPLETRELGIDTAVELELQATADHEILVAAARDGRVTRIPLVHEWRWLRSVGSPSDSPFADRITALSFAPAGDQLAVGGGQPSRDGELHVLNVADGSLRTQFENAHSDTIFGLAFSPDGKQIASCGADRFMKVFDLETGKLIRNFEGHTHHVLCVSWRADGRVLATGGADKLVKVWNAVDGSQLKTIQGFGKEVVAIEFDGTSDHFYAASGDNQLYRCQVGGERKSIGRGSDFLYAVSANAEGDQVVFAGHDSVIRVVDREGKTLAELSP